MQLDDDFMLGDLQATIQVSLSLLTKGRNVAWLKPTRPASRNPLSLSPSSALPFLSSLPLWRAAMKSEKNAQCLQLQCVGENPYSQRMHSDMEL